MSEYNLKWWRCPDCGHTRQSILDSVGYCDGCHCSIDLHGPYDTEAEAKGGDGKRWMCLICNHVIDEAENPNRGEYMCNRCLQVPNSWIPAGRNTTPKPSDEPWWQCTRCDNAFQHPADPTTTTCARCGNKGWVRKQASKPPDERWWRCVECVRVVRAATSQNWNDMPFCPIPCKKCQCKDWHGPFATRQAAEEVEYPRWRAHTDHTSGVLWKTDPGWLKDHLEHVKSMFERPWLTMDMSSSKAYKDEMSSIIPKSKEDTDMSAIFCDGCRKAFPREESYRIDMVAVKHDRRDEKLERHDANYTNICDECFATLMAEPMVAKLPWTTWRKGDDDE